jgi:hypothetical protein
MTLILCLFLKAIQTDCVIIEALGFHLVYQPFYQPSLIVYRFKREERRRENKGDICHTDAVPIIVCRFW